MLLASYMCGGDIHLQQQHKLIAVFSSFRWTESFTVYTIYHCSHSTHFYTLLSFHFCVFDDSRICIFTTLFLTFFCSLSLSSCFSVSVFRCMRLSGCACCPMQWNTPFRQTNCQNRWISGASVRMRLCCLCGAMGLACDRL